MGILYISVDTESKRNLPGLFIKFMYTERILESIRYFDIFVLTQKKYCIYMVFLYICVDTKRILESTRFIY